MYLVRSLCLATMQAGLLCAFTLPASIAHADTYKRIDNREEFIETIAGRELKLRVLGIELVVNEEGTISGDALGWTVSGTWHWKDGYFCRQMDWSGTEVPYNCQLVELRKDSDVRFTLDQGKGDSATFRVR